MARTEQQEARAIWLAKIAEEQEKAEASFSPTSQVHDAASKNDSSSIPRLRASLKISRN